MFYNRVTSRCEGNDRYRIFMARFYDDKRECVLGGLTISDISMGGRNITTIHPCDLKRSIYSISFHISVSMCILISWYFFFPYDKYSYIYIFIFLIFFRIISILIRIFSMLVQYFHFALYHRSAIFFLSHNFFEIFDVESRIFPSWIIKEEEVFLEIINRIF